MVLYTHTHTIHLENRKATTKNEINSKELYESTKVNEQNKDITMFSKNKENAITLIALVITIIVLLILAGVSIAMLTGTNGILTQAQKAKMTTELSSYKEQLELYKTEQLSENREFLESTLTVGKESLKYNTQPEGEIGNIKTVIPNIKDEYIDKVEIIKGSLLINTQDKNEIEIAKSLGIAANPYDIVNGELLSSNGNLLLMDETGTLTIPDSVTKIGEGAFANLSGLKTIIIPSTVKEIGMNAFAFNNTLENVIINDGVEIIGSGAFQQCKNLKNVDLPNSVNSMGSMAFYYCSKLEKIRIPDNIESILLYTFCGCKNLNNIILPQKLKEIQEHALQETALETITIPSSVVTLGNSVFVGCTKLSEIDLEGNNNYVYENGFLMDSSKENILFISNSYLSNVNVLDIPEGIISFNTGISGYDNITEIKIPSTLTSISYGIMPKNIKKITVDPNNTKFVAENNILYTTDTKSLILCYSHEKNINIQDGILEICTGAFYSATNVENLTLPESVTTILESAFGLCHNMKQINIGAKVSKISPICMFWGCNANVTISKNNPNYMVDNGFLYTKDKKTLVACLKSCKGEIIIDSGVENIGFVAFDAQEITKVILPQSIKTIETYAFSQCEKLESIEIPNSIISIAVGAFDRCSNLSEINIDKEENSISGAPWGAPKGIKAVNWKK